MLSYQITGHDGMTPSMHPLNTRKEIKKTKTKQNRKKKFKKVIFKTCRVWKRDSADLVSVLHVLSYFRSVKVKVEKNVNACVTQQRCMTLTLTFYHTVEGKIFHGIDGSRVSAVIWMFLFLFLLLHKLETRAQTDRQDPLSPLLHYCYISSLQNMVFLLRKRPDQKYHLLPQCHCFISKYMFTVYQKHCLCTKYTVGVYTVQ